MRPAVAPKLPPRTRLAFLWIALIPMVLAAVAIRLGSQFQSELTAVTHSYDVRATIREATVVLTNSDRALRSYLLTGHASYLLAMQKDAAEARNQAARLQRLTAGDPAQRSNAAALDQRLEAKLADMGRELDMLKSQGRDAVLDPTEIDHSQQVMEQVRDVARQMMEQEERALLLQTQTQSRTGQQTEVIFGAAVALTLLLLLWAGRVARTHEGGRAAAEKALRQKVLEIESMNRELESHVRERTAELRESNERLARSHTSSRRLAAIVESSEDAILAKSLDGVIESWNTGAEHLYGYRSEEIVGHDIRDLVPAERFREVAEILEKLRHGERVEHFETIRVCKGGESVEVSLTISPIRSETGEIVGASEVARDISDQKRNASLLRETQKLESLGVLAGGIAHDFNNLLVGIVGNTSLALNELPHNSPLRPLLANALAASERAGDLTRQMLAYSGRGRFVLDRVDLSDFVREAVPLVQAAVPRTVEVKLDLVSSLPAIEADKTQLQQLVMNLVINGAEAIPDGNHGIVTVTTRQETVADSRQAASVTGAGEVTPGDYVVLEVTDTGAGMDQATKSRIFDPFFTTKFTGRGLGLAAVLGIVRGHKGAIEVISSPGAGTTFCVLLPAASVLAVQAPVAEQPRDLFGEGTILVIDDEPMVLAVTRHVLERYGYNVLLTENGRRGVDLFRREAERIRCVVLDMTMPVMSGEETLSHLKALRADLPVILSSGFSEAEAVRRFEGMGLAAFIQKPYRSEVLLEKIKKVLGASKTGQFTAGS